MSTPLSDGPLALAGFRLKSAHTCSWVEWMIIGDGHGKRRYANEHFEGPGAGEGGIVTRPASLAPADGSLA